MTPTDQLPPPQLPADLPLAQPDRIEPPLPPPEPDRFDRGVPAARRRGRRALVAACMAAAVLAGGTAGVVTSRWGDESDGSATSSVTATPLSLTTGLDMTTVVQLVQPSVVSVEVGGVVVKSEPVLVTPAVAEIEV